jgi:hypothetical protein
MAEYFTKDGDEYKKVDENLLTQADVDKVVETRLERQKKQYADYDDLKEKAGKVDTISKEFEEKLKGKDTEIETVKGELGTAKLETVKVKAIHEFKLSDDLSEFLNGADEDTIRTQAEKLSKGIPGGSVVVTKDGKPDEKTSDTKKVAQGLFGKKSDD